MRNPSPSSDGVPPGAEATPSPCVRVRPSSGRRERDSSRWLLAWSVRNNGPESLQLLRARLPHDHFHSDELELGYTPSLPPQATVRVELPVSCDAEPGAVIENAFLILRVLCQGRQWRILTRLRVIIDRTGAPGNTVELVTTQPVGFSYQRADD